MVPCSKSQDLNPPSASRPHARATYIGMKQMTEHTYLAYRTITLEVVHEALNSQTQGTGQERAVMTNVKLVNEWEV